MLDGSQNSVVEKFIGNITEPGGGSGGEAGWIRKKSEIRRKKKTFDKGESLQPARRRLVHSEKRNPRKWAS